MAVSCGYEISLAVVLVELGLDALCKHRVVAQAVLHLILLLHRVTNLLVQYGVGKVVLNSSLLPF